MHRFVLVYLAGLFCCCSAFAAPAPSVTEKPAARIIFHGDSVLNNLDQLKVLEYLVSHNTDTIHLDSVEPGVTYTKGGTFLLPFNSPVKTEDLAEAEGGALFFEDVPVWETPFSMLVLDPSDDSELAELISSCAASVLLDGERTAVPKTAQAGVLETVSGSVYKLVSPSGVIPFGAWQPAVYTSYQLSYKGRKTTVSIMAKTAGGIGFWQAGPVKNSAPEMPGFVINTGGVSKYDGIVSSSVLADYYAAGTDVLAFEGGDLHVLKSYLLDGAQLAPAAICGNLDRKEGLASGWRKYTVLDAGGVKIGVYSLISAAAVNSKTANEYGLSVGDYMASGREIIKTLRDKEKVDFIVFVSHLQSEELAWYLLGAPGNDAVIQAQPRTNTVARTVSSTELNGWRQQVNRDPAVNVWRSPFNMGELEIEFSSANGAFVPVRVRELTGNNRAVPPDVKNQSYRLNYKLFSDLSGRRTELLPDPRELWDSLYYTPLAVYNMTANVLRERTGAEAAFVRLRNFPTRFPGSVSPIQFGRWVEPEKIYTGYIKGASLKELAKFVDFTEVNGTNDTNYAGKYNLASAGLTADGRIANIPIDKDEVYKIAFTEDLLKEKEVFKPFAAVFDSTSVPDADMLGVVTDWLDDAKDDCNRDADAEYADFLKSQSGVKAKGIVAVSDEDAIKNSLYKEGRLGELYEIFNDRALDKYYARLRAISQHRDDIRPFVRLNLRKLELRFSETDITNSTLYSGFSNAKLTSDSQMLLQGAMDCYLEYFKDNLRWDNGVSMSYGKVTLYPASGGSITNESVDQLLFVSELVYKRYRVEKVLGGFLAGPFMSLGYETEFHAANNANTNKVLRGKGGIKLYQGANIKDLYLAGVVEEDFTYSPNRRKYAWETGFALEQNPAPNLRLRYEGSYRNFFRNSSDIATDYLYELSLSAAAEIDLWGNLKFAPYASLYQARGKFTDEAGRNVQYGLSLKYAFIYKPFIY